MKLKHIILFASTLTFMSCSSNTEHNQTEEKVLEEKIEKEVEYEEVIEQEDKKQSFGTLSYTLGQESESYDKAESSSMQITNNLFSVRIVLGSGDMGNYVMMLTVNTDMKNKGLTAPSQFEIKAGADGAAFQIGDMGKTLKFKEGVLNIESYNEKEGTIKGSITGKGKILALVNDVQAAMDFQAGKGLSDAKFDFDIKVEVKDMRQ